MPKNKQNTVSLTLAIVPAVIAAIAGVIGAYLSYSAGVDAIRIPLMATQTAEAKQLFANLPQGATSNAISIPIPVDSTKTWQPTNVFIREGDVMNIRVVGGQWATWREELPNDLKEQISGDENVRNANVWIDWYPKTNGDGLDSVMCQRTSCPFYNYNAGVLLAKIGNTIYSIGNSCSIQLSVTGQIYLQINDGILEDNEGMLVVEIIIDPINTFQKSAKCGATFSQ